jgi:dCMP deaminase
MKKKYIKAHMKAAYIYAELSSCKRRKVGCVIVKHNSIIAIGYNGTPSGEDNCCEDTTTGLTKPHVIHAEDNALRKLTNSSESGAGAVMFITTAPCIFCASRIVDAGIKHVFYDDLYRSADGVAYLQGRGITVDQISI